ncbi:hypothetical protein U2F10_24240 [Leptothoe sp. EHU-05/26/07-4]
MPSHPGINRVFPKDQLGKLKKFSSLNTQTAISRSKEYYQWPEDTHAVLLDHDPEPSQPELDADQFWQALVSCVPELERCGRVVTMSTSSSIYDKATGACLKPATGHHTYLMVRGDVERLKRILKVRTWLNGHGFHKLARANAQTGVTAIHQRTLVDLSVFSAERLVYEAGAIVPDEWEQRRPAPQLFKGDVLDIDTLPEPTPEELAEVEHRIKESRKLKEPERTANVIEHIKKEQPDLTPEECSNLANERIETANQATLEKDHTLYLSNGQIITAGDIGPDHHGQTLCDPQEPSYRGGRSDVARIFCQQPGNWTITSFAHSQDVAPRKYRPAWSAVANEAGKTDATLKAAHAQVKKAAATAAKWAAAVGQDCTPLDIATLPDVNTAKAETQRYREIERKHRQTLLNSARGKAMPNDRVINPGSAMNEVDFERIARYDGPVVISGETGCGKTEFAAQLAVYLQQRYGNLTYHGVSPTQTLSIEKAARFSAKGLTMKSSADDTGNTFNQGGNLDTPAESLYKIKGQRVDYLAADEPDTWILRVLKGLLGDAADPNLAQLQALIKEVPVQLWLNADINPITVDFLADISGEPVKVVELIREQPRKPVKVDLFLDDEDEHGETISGAGAFYQSLIDDALAGKQILVLAGSVRKARGLKGYFNHKKTASKLRRALKQAGVRVVFRDGTYSTKTQKRGFAAKPDETVRDAQIVILTRLAETGIDLQRDFDVVYCAASPKMAASSVNQFFSRCRSLLRGDTPKLCVYSPRESFTSIEQLTESYWADKERQENQRYLALLKGDTTKVKEQLKNLDWAIDWAAKYEAWAARQRFFRTDLLLDKCKALDWSVREVRSDPGTNKAIKTLLDKKINAAEWMRCRTIARGKRTLEDYQTITREDGTCVLDALAYRSALLDPTESGFILNCHRRKLELSRLFPDSALENKELIHTLENQQGLLAQMLLRAAIELGSQSDQVAQLIQLISDDHLETLSQTGILQGLKELKGSKALLTLQLADGVGQHRMVQRILNGVDDEIALDREDVIEFAQLLAANAGMLNLWSQKYWGKEFVWDEDPISTVCKFLDKYLGIITACARQPWTTIDGRKKRVRVMQTNLSEKGRAAISKEVTKKQIKAQGVTPSAETRQAFTEQALEQLAELNQFIEGLIKSAVTGWQQRLHAFIAKDSDDSTVKTRPYPEDPLFTVLPEGTPPPDGPIERLNYPIKACHRDADPPPAGIQPSKSQQ